MSADARSRIGLEPWKVAWVDLPVRPSIQGRARNQGNARRVDAFRPVPRYQETWTETVPAEVGASRLNASLYRSITRPLPQAHQSISFT